MWEHLPLIYAGIAAASGATVTALSLRRLGRAVAWNAYLKLIGVEASERRELALNTARLDLRVDRPGPGRVAMHQPEDSAQPMRRSPVPVDQVVRGDEHLSPPLVTADAALRPPRPPRRRRTRST
jgi:hypothetical protein